MNGTYLYIKQHEITGLKYFGKTTKNPETYLGSGKYWKKHIKKYGQNFVKTIWYQLFIDKNELIQYALDFSKRNNIVNSKEWANLKEENGLDGGMKKGWWTEDQLKNNSEYQLKYYQEHPEKRQILSKKAKEYWDNLSEEEKTKRKEHFAQIRKLSSGSKGKTWNLSENTKQKQRKPKSQKHRDNISVVLKGNRIGEKNPSYGSIWITNELISKKINKTKTIPDGWRFGRAFKPRKKQRELDI